MKKLRVIFAGIMAVAMLLININVPVAYAKTQIVKKDSFPLSATVWSADGMSYVYWSEMPYLYADGDLAFCIEPEQFVANGDSYKKSKLSLSQRDLLEQIAYVGWELSDKTDNDYAVTQFMIWEALGCKISSHNLSGYASKKKQIQNKIDKLFYSFPSFRNQAIELDIGESVTLTDKNSVFQYYNLDSKSTGITVKKSGNKLTITAATSAPENAKVSYQLIKKDYVGTSMLYSSNTEQDVAVFYRSDPREMKVNIKVNKYGSLKIAKLDEDGTYVPNTSFKVSKSSDMSSPLGTYKTGSDGTVTVSDLAPGTYYVQETAVPDHLVLDDTIHKVTVNANETATFTANNNWKKGKVQIRKTDKESDKQVAGAVYGIFDKSGNEVERLTTLIDGFVESGWLRFGEYYVQEIIAPDGYVLDDTKYPVNITENEQTIYVTGVNQRVKGTINIEKQDSVTGSSAQGEATLFGAVYGLYAREDILDPADHSVKYQANAKVAELTIGEDLKASATDLYLGKYYLKEITPSDGYTLDETEYDVELSYQGQTTATVSVNQIVKERVKAQAFQIIKVSDNGSGETDLLKGTEFTVKAQKDINKYGSWEAAPIAKNAQGETAALLVTDKKGYAISEKLPYGSYIVRETKTPDDHYSVPDFTVTISEDSDEPQVWRIFNDVKFRAVIAMVKLDVESGKIVKLAGATFKIRDLEMNEYVGYWEWNPLPHYVTEWTTTEDGTVMTGDVLDPGEYQIEEITAPNGYVLNTEPVKFKVTTNTAYETLPDGTTPVITVKMSDKAVKGQITIEKIGDVLTGFENGRFVYEKRGIAGMEADVIAAENILDPANDGSIIYEAGTVVDTITTGADGKATSKKIPLGKYKVKETKAPEGFVLNGKEYEVELKYADQETAIVSESVTVQNEKQDVSLKVLKQENGTPLSGGRFGLYAGENIKGYDGSVLVEKDAQIATAAAENGIVEFDVDLPLSSYYVKELEAPAGYIKTDEVIQFDASYQGQDVLVVELEAVLENEKTQIEITKTDITGEQELAGAHLQVVDANGEIIDSWVSDGTAHRIEGLTVGETYRLIETIAPDGYSITDEVTFTVQNTAEIQKVQMKDDLTHIQVLKVDENNEPMAGNELAIIDSEGNIVEQWISEEMPRDVYGLTGGAEYILKEIKAADGYGTAKEITFTVPTTANDVITITMSNQPTEMLFEKIDDDFKLLSGATLQVIEKENGIVVDEWVTNEEAHVIRYLIEGKEYILHEVKAPVGYEAAEDIHFIAEDNKTITMQDQRILTDVETGVDSNTVLMMIYGALLFASIGSVIVIWFVHKTVENDRKKKKKG